MQSNDYRIAWDHPRTRHAWVKHMAMNTAGLVGWAATAVGILLITLATPVWTVAVFLPLFVYAFYRFYLQIFYFPLATRIQRIMWHYPWQVIRDAPHGLAPHPDGTGKDPWISFANPAKPDEQVPVHFRYVRTTWWRRRMAPRAKPELKTQLAEIWFAGDPRFFGIIAVPRADKEEPKRLHLLFHRGAYRPVTDPNPWRADAHAVERARRAGARGVAGA